MKIMEDMNSLLTENRILIYTKKKDIRKFYSRYYSQYYVNEKRSNRQPRFFRLFLLDTKHISKTDTELRAARIDGEDGLMAIFPLRYKLAKNILGSVADMDTHEIMADAAYRLVTAIDNAAHFVGHDYLSWYHHIGYGHNTRSDGDEIYIFVPKCYCLSLDTFKHYIRDLNVLMGGIQNAWKQQLLACTEENKYVKTSGTSWSNSEPLRRTCG